MEENKTNRERGILMVATSHAYYGRLAYNLASTIKGVEDFPIAIVRDDKSLTHLSIAQRSVFDIEIPLPEKASGGFTPKLYINELSPFKQTLYLDVDMLWLPFRTPTQLFDELKDCDYTGITEGWYDITTDNHTNERKDYYFWADLKEILTTYNLTEGIMYQWRSEVIYFNKTEQINKFFKDCQKIHANPNLKTIRKFGAHVPDELSINISSAINEIDPHRVKWTPAYWHKLHQDRVPQIGELQQWYLLSFGSNHSLPSVKRLYDKVTSISLKKQGRQHVFGLHSKKEFMSVERNKI